VIVDAGVMKLCAAMKQFPACLLAAECWLRMEQLGQLDTLVDGCSCPLWPLMVDHLQPPSIYCADDGGYEEEDESCVESP
jgi:hypothetical protein